MDVNGRDVLVCDCERTMPIDGAALARACGGGAPAAVASQLCGRQLNRFLAALEPARPVLVGCTQQAPLFRAAAGDAGRADADVSYVNLRETAGWSVDPAAALPKIAGLIAAAAQPAAPTPATVTMRSNGVTLIYGRDGTAIEVAERLKDRLDLTVVLTGGADVAPPLAGSADYPIVRGTVARAAGHLGGFELRLDGFATPNASSRRRLEFTGPVRDGAISRCDLIIDLSGGTPLFPAHEKRDGYLRPDPRDTRAVAEAVLAAADLSGTFDKPRYVTYDASICAHSRSRKIGCSNCLDVCPTGAITSLREEGDGQRGVAVDPYVCAGCGTCTAVCPTGAITFAAAPPATLATRLRALLLGYHDAGGRRPVLLLHDARHGLPLINALARFGDGLPANVLPLPIDQVTQIGLDTLAPALAYGAAAVRILAPARQARDELDPLRGQIDLAGAILAGLGDDAERVRLLEIDDPDLLAEALAVSPPAWPAPARFLALGSKRDILTMALEALQTMASHAPPGAVAIPLPAGAPFGRLAVDTEHCTLCLSCTTVCPTGALGDHPERPTVSFVEDACVQCGLCAAICPEHVIALEPRLVLGASRRERVVIKAEEPAACVRCGKPFGSRATVELVVAKLAGQHWMFGDPAAIERIRMCADCRVVAHAMGGKDPHAGPPRPPTRA